jgi:hypothetical protein
MFCQGLCYCSAYSLRPICKFRLDRSAQSGVFYLVFVILRRESEAPYKGLFLTSSGHDHHKDVKEKEWNGEGKRKNDRIGSIPHFPMNLHVSAIIHPRDLPEHCVLKIQGMYQGTGVTHVSFECNHIE